MPTDQKRRAAEALDSTTAPVVSRDREACQPEAFHLLAPPAWYALRVASHREFRAANALAAAGFAEYLPVIPEVSRWTDRQKIIHRPLFSGYIFAKFDLSRATEILATAGVMQILATSLNPTAIPDAEIANLRRALESPAAAAECPYVAGASVVIDSGPLAGVAGVIVRTRGTTRVVVRCEILRRAVAVEVDAADIQKALPRETKPCYPKPSSSRSSAVRSI